MMFATSRLDYGMRALIYLATSSSPVASADIARDNDLPAKFLADILGDLRRAGLVHAKRGGQGGFWLARPADAITVADVVRVLAGGPEAFLHTTPIQSLWAALDDAVIGAAERITVQDLCGRGDLRARLG
jgi:Rrf2 family protein